MFCLSSFQVKCLTLPLLILGATLVCSRPALSDDLDSATIKGLISDSSGAVIAGAVVRIRDTGRNQVTNLTTRATGEFLAARLAPGSYEIEVEVEGFQRFEQKNVQLESGQTMVLNIAMHIGRLEQVMVVTEAAPAIDLSKTVVGGTLAAREIEMIPINGRDPLDLVFLFPGVTEETFDTRDAAKPANGQFLSDTPIEAGIFSLSGGRGFSNNLTIDGLDNNDDREARERISYSREVIEEVQVITNQFSAEYGRASGGRVNLRTRSGSNQFHGRGYFFFQDESLNANSFFRNLAGEARAPYQRRQDGFFFTGPIRVDRIFFMIGYERDDTPDTTEINLPLPFETNPRYPLPQPNVQLGSIIYRPSGGTPILGGRFIEEVSTPAQRNFVSARIDAVLSQKHNLFARYEISRGSSLTGFTGGSRFPSTAVARTRDSQAWSITENFVVNPSWINQARYQYSRLLPSNLEGLGAQPVAVVVNGSSGFSAGGSASTFTSNRRGKRTEVRQQFVDNITFVRGRSTFKTGLDIQRVDSRDLDLFESNGIYSFSNIADFLTNQPSRFLQAVGNPEGQVTNTVAGIYLQQELRLRPHFSLNLGFRYDLETALSSDRNNLGPRFSFSWDPFKSGKTVVRGGFGIFYNRVLLRTFGDFAGRSGLRYVDLRTADDVQRAFPGLSVSEAGSFLSNLFPKILPNSAEIFSVASAAEDTRRISGNLRIPYSEQASFGVEREIRRGLVVEASYQFNHGVKLWRDHNINAPIPPPGGLLNYLLNGRFALSMDNTLYSDVRFDLGTSTTVPAPHGGVIQTPLILGLNAPSLISGSSTARFVRLLFEAVRPLRPDPTLLGIDQLESSGSSTYNALTVALTRQSSHGISFRTSYTLSKLFEDTFINTATPQDEFNLRAERSLGNTDQRHRFVFQGTLEIPKLKIVAVPVLTFGSGRPFTIGNGGSDRNLSDRATDRPNLVQLLDRRPTLAPKPGGPPPLDPDVFFALPTIGTSGNLGRNVGLGPAQHRVDVALSRTFQIREHWSVRPQVEIFNVFNNVIFFVNGFADITDSDFLQPRAARRPRTIQLSLRMDF
ncbi:MAG: carboxypeptidase regulatory-like domain-containing protein [Acidobacteriia bacterium]|nr:carboxypeptidase regulatory-like domain-containing protein [Terriglobia bacterium]